MDILGPLPKTRHGNRFLLVIADRYSKLTGTIPLRVTTALAVAQAFCDHWVFVYGPPVSLLTDNAPQLRRSSFRMRVQNLVSRRSSLLHTTRIQTDRSSVTTELSWRICERTSHDGRMTGTSIPLR
jgi:hypothetical protein